MELLGPQINKCVKVPRTIVTCEKLLFLWDSKVFAKNMLHTST